MFCSKSRKQTSILHSLLEIGLKLIPQQSGVTFAVNKLNFWRNQEDILILVIFF